MHIDFDEIVDRRGTYSSKWDVKDGELPLSTADMDFKAAPEIIAALEKRVAHGIFGYTDVADEWYDVIIDYYDRRHGLKFSKDDLLFATGVIPTISSVIRKLTTPAEKVLVMTPVYNIFFNSIINNGRFPLESELIVKDGQYTIDFDDLEAKLKDPQCTMMILCDPHNPVGRIWHEDELVRIGELCFKNHVTVISDEIHGDLTDPGKRYVPFASVSELNKRISITCIAASKAYNLAGLQSSAIVVYDERLRNKVRRAINTDEVAEPNAFAMVATIAAFKESEYWLDELRDYYFANKEFIKEYIAKNIPALKILDSEATYLLWIDHSALKIDSTALSRHIRETSGLILSDGSIYHGDGLDHLRMNTAYPRSVIKDALERLKKSIDILEERKGI